MSPIGLLGIVAGIVIFVRGALFLRSTHRTPEELLAFLFVGGAITFISIFPSSVTPYVIIFGFQSNSVFVLIIAVLILTLLVFWLYGMVIDLKDKLSKLHDQTSIIMERFSEEK